MRAPKGHTNAPSRKRTVYLAPYQEEWLQARAAAKFPDGEPQGPRSAVSRFLRGLVEAEMERSAGAPPDGDLREAALEAAALLSSLAGDDTSVLGGFTRGLMRLMADRLRAAGEAGP